ncbi:hypothetical protein FUT87_07425 [Mitsuaria sp. TWR114]|uniref:hypothetical protein n=1 Tax=Mitsuaria sp. TWR114 TaxID=2601731 RepID=UPI0011BD776F|nr:hypothetical protein [Mitsuaria sp. TWR114]TXD94232.1 hypothetical protein FUT87_07425 [Mitsuaria sp. TWR114]
MTLSIHAHPADRIFNLLTDTAEPLSLDDGRALCKMTPPGDHLVAVLAELKGDLTSQAFLRLLGEQLPRTGRTSANTNGVQSLLLDVEEDDLCDVMSTEEQRIHRGLDEAIDLYTCPSSYGIETWWYLTQEEALLAQPGGRQVLKARAPRANCIVQLYAGGFCIVPTLFLEEAVDA